MINTYYIYFHRNPNTNDVFYVGLGLDRRAWDRSRGRNQRFAYMRSGTCTHLKFSTNVSVPFLIYAVSSSTDY